MTITVLLAPDGSVVDSLFGKKAVSGFFALIAHEKYVELRGTAFFPGEAEPYVLAPGYCLEHHDLAELLARPSKRKPNGDQRRRAALNERWFVQVASEEERRAYRRGVADGKDIAMFGDA
jgi:hypothetical protein